MPVEPSFPKLAIMIPLGVLLGLVSGIGLAVLLEFVDTSIRRPSDVAQKLDIPLLGIIPHADDVEDDFEDVRTALLTHRDSLMGETFRQIRTNLQFSGPTQQHKTLLITSASPEDGRTTVAVNLAVAVANAGSKVLLIDANFRQPAIAELFPQAPEGGLSSALVEQAHWQESVAEVEPNLHVMGAGPLPPNPAELLGSQRMAALLQEVGSQYDQVIIDGAPCLVVTDSVILSRSVDAVLLVLRAGVNTHGVASKVRGMLRTVDAHVVGAVLNSVRAMAGGYLRKNYDAYYDYQEAPKLPAR
jgi:capsular exopolysaccharide synthesis family protein